jgi:hypothetical protein
MDASTSGLAAAGALLAAVFSGVNLYLTGRREETKWKREALLDAYDRYLALSRNRDHVADRIAKSRAAGKMDDVDGLRAEETRLHEEQLDVLTRLRLLSSREIIASAEALHLSDHELIDAAMEVQGGGDRKRYEQKRIGNKDCKAQLIDEVRKSLRLPGDTRFDPAM